MGSVYTLILSNGNTYPYKIIRSKRAKYLRIKLSNRGGLSITIPHLTEIGLAHEFIDSKKSWVEKNLLNVKQVNKLPEILTLKLLEEVWKVVYIENTAKNSGLTLKERKDTVYPQEKIIEIIGDFDQINDWTLVAKLLNRWCKKKAVNIFTVMLEGLAETHGFHYQKLTIRAQKTRWGSCSSKKNINLNCKLLFMPRQVVEYVMVHELCHTIEMNHSSRFWALVQDCDSDYRQNKHILRALGNEVPI